MSVYSAPAATKTYDWHDPLTIVDSDGNHYSAASYSDVYDSGDKYSFRHFKDGSVNNADMGPYYILQNSGSNCIDDGQNATAIRGFGFNVGVRDPNNYANQFYIGTIQAGSKDPNTGKYTCAFVSGSTQSINIGSQGNLGTVNNGTDIVAVAADVGNNQIFIYSFFNGGANKSLLRNNRSGQVDGLAGNGNVVFQLDSNLPTNTHGIRFYDNPSEPTKEKCSANDPSGAGSFRSVLAIDSNNPNTGWLFHQAIICKLNFKLFDGKNFASTRDDIFIFNIVKPLTTPITENGSGSSGGGQTPQTCDAGNLSWLVCSIVDQVNNVNKFVLNTVLIPFLNTKPLTSNDQIAGIWKNIRTLADVLLVPVFFVLIFAQALSLNIDAYTIKKMLPRLVVATILIQFSFYIAAIAVDITNVIGNGLGNLMAAHFSTPAASVAVSGAQSFLGGITKVVVITGGLAYLATQIFVIIVPLVLVLLAIMLTLVFRQLVIVLLAILAPLAFLAWVLPATSKFFKLWWDTLIKALLMYPLIVALFAAGTIVASILTQTSLTSTNGVPQDLLKDFAAIVAVMVPLAAVPFTFKFAGTALGGIAGQVDKLRGRAMYDKQGKPLAWRQNQLDASRSRKGDLARGEGAGYHIPGVGEVRLGRGKLGQFIAQPSRLIGLGGRATRAAQRGIGTATEAASKDMANFGANTLPAAQMILGGQRRYEEMVKGKSGQDLRNLQTIWSIVRPMSRDGAHIRAAADVIAQASQTDKTTYDDVRSHFGGLPEGSRVWTSLALGSIARSPHILAGVSYESGKIRKGAAAGALAGVGIDKAKDYSVDTIAHAMRDKYDVDNGSNQTLSDETIEQLLSDSRVPEASKRVIRTAQEAYTGGRTVQDALWGTSADAKALRDQVRLKDSFDYEPDEPTGGTS